MDVDAALPHTTRLMPDRRGGLHVVRSLRLVLTAFALAAVLALAGAGTAAAIPIGGTTPVATSFTRTIAEHGYVDLTPPGLFGYSYSPVARSLSLEVGSWTPVGVGGSSIYLGTGQVTYTPAGHWSGSVSLPWRVFDGFEYSNWASMTVVVTPVNDGPEHDWRVDNPRFTIDEDTVYDSGTPGLLNGFSDPEGDPMTAEIVQQGANGTATVDADGSFSYTPKPEFYGNDYFIFRVTDGQIASGEYWAYATVNQVDDPPIGRPDFYSTKYAQPLAVYAPGVLGNDFDPDDWSLTAQLVAGPSHGTLTLPPPPVGEEDMLASMAGGQPLTAVGQIGSNGSFYYAPDAGFTGTDTFTYRVSDGTNLSDPVTVSIYVGAPDAGTQVGRPWSPYIVWRNSRFLVFGSLGFRHPAGKPAVTMRCYRFEAGQWVLKKSFAVKAPRGRRVRYAGYISLPERGRWKLIAEHTDGDGVTAASPSRLMWVR
jgi:hypothetical protein